MKRLFAAILCLCLLAGCGRTDSTGNTCRAEEGSGGGDVSGKTEEPGADAGASCFRVIRSQAGAAPLLLAKESGGPGDVYTLSPTTVEPTLDGRSTAAMDLVYTPGTLLEITYGSVLETYPGQLAEVTAVNIRSDGFDDRCALYLRVLNDLWAVDEGLNSDITMLSVDLSQTGLSDSEQAAGSVGIRRDARYFRDHDHELRGIGGGGVSLRHGPGGRRDPPLEGRLLVHHYGAERAGQHPCGTGQQKYYRRRPAAPYRREKRRCLPTASGGGRTRAVRLLSGKNEERRTGRFAEHRDLRCPEVALCAGGLLLH